MKGSSLIWTGWTTLIALVIMGSFGVGCANIIPPSGGDRDTLPPVLIMAIPRDSATQIKTRNITLTFNEFVNLKETEQIIVSPIPKNVPIFDYKLRNVTVRLRDSLEPNTTYSIDFGNSIRDVNEDNVAQNFRYVFSTGDQLDNNDYEGQVIVAEKGTIDSTLIVVLHADLSDSAIYSKQPRYFTRVNGKGRFSFQNLPDGRFNVYVLNGKNYSKTFDSTDLFAFRNEAIRLPINDILPDDTLWAFTEAPKPPAGRAQEQPTSAFRDDKRLRYQSSAAGEPQDLLDKLTLTFNRKLFTLDTSKIALLDSNYRAAGNYEVTLSADGKQVFLTHDWKADNGYRLILEKESVADSLGVTLAKRDTVSLHTLKESAYGALRFRFQNLDTTVRPVIQLVQNEEVLASYPITSNSLSIKRIKPGTYQLRILYDENGNGKWDQGQFSTQPRKQPEKVVSIPRQLSIRANWDNEVTIGL